MLRLAAVCFLAGLILGACAPSPGVRWSDVLELFNLRDEENPPVSGSVLFIGSSSVHRWLDLDHAFPDVSVLNQGVSGSQLSELIYYVDRLVLPYDPSLIVVYAGENDLARGKSPESVLAAYHDFVSRVREQRPEQRIVFLTIKPSPARARLLPRIRRANELIATYTLQNDNLDYLDVASPMFDLQGRIRRDLFVRDGVHMNARGYALWRDVLTPYLVGALQSGVTGQSEDATADAP